MEIRLIKKFQTALSDPSFEEALGIVIHAAAMAGGASVTVSVEWK